MMNRTVERWRECVPKSMATEQSAVAREFAFCDARSDILELNGINGALCELIEEAEGPLRRAMMAAMTSGDAGVELELRDLLKRMREAML